MYQYRDLLEKSGRPVPASPAMTPSEVMFVVFVVKVVQRVSLWLILAPIFVLGLILKVHQLLTPQRLAFIFLSVILYVLIRGQNHELCADD